MFYSRNKRSRAENVYYVCISIKQRIDDMYTQVAIRTFTIGSLMVYPRRLALPFFFSGNKILLTYLQAVEVHHNMA